MDCPTAFWVSESDFLVCAGDTRNAILNATGELPLMISYSADSRNSVEIKHSVEGTLISTGPLEASVSYSLGKVWIFKFISTTQYPRFCEFCVHDSQLTIYRFTSLLDCLIYFVR